PISHWMTPEHHAEEAAAQHAAPLAAVPGADMAQRLSWGLAFMEKNHPGAEMWELWPSDAQGAGKLTAYWYDSARAYAEAQLDPATGELLPPSPRTGRDTLGGHHFVDFHYRLHAGHVGLWIVGIAGLAMLVALISGVITHRRIFVDFFTFRPRKGQRSWLDAHNVTGVLTLPFLLMIVYTGIAISGVHFMPAGVHSFFGPGKQGVRAYQSALDAPGQSPRSGQAMAVPDLAAFALRGQQLMGQPVRAVVIAHPGDAQARIGVYGWNEEGSMLRRLSTRSGMVMFSAATGKVLQVRRPGEVDGGAALLVKEVMGSLHTLKYGGLALKWLYFVCGLAGSAMVATGAVL
ncbi:MAG: PepSY-associated TM helix domain-containing protein, partial [Comamonas sp.]